MTTRRVNPPEFQNFIETLKALTRSSYQGCVRRSHERTLVKERCSRRSCGCVDKGRFARFRRASLAERVPWLGGSSQRFGVSSRSDRPKHPCKGTEEETILGSHTRRHTASDNGFSVVTTLPNILIRPRCAIGPAVVSNGRRRFTCLEVANVAKLEFHKQQSQERIYRCPNHDDKHPSLMINESKDTFMCGPCDAKGTAWQLAAFLAKVEPGNTAAVKRWCREHGLTQSNSATGNGNGNHARKIVATYDYVDENGTLLYQNVRYEPKDFCQRRPDGCVGWIYNTTGVRRVLYSLPVIVLPAPGSSANRISMAGAAAWLRTLP